MRGVDELRPISGYRTLLTFYWWTAPLAWLYAIPVEQFLSEGDATVANLGLLAAVSVWRVLAITRALSVWLGANFVGMFFIVMFFADSVALAVAYFSPWPIFNIMGGVRLSESDAAVLGALLNVMVFGGISWLVWLIAAGIVIGKRTPMWRLLRSPHVERRVSIATWLIAGLCPIFGIALLPVGQPQQQRRADVEERLYAGQFDQAIEYVAKLSRDDFPPVWDPPPRLGYGERSPPILPIIEAIDRHRAAAWFRDLYVRKLSQEPQRLLWDAAPHQQHPDQEELRRAIDAIEKHIPAKSLDSELRWEIEYFADESQIDTGSRKRLREYLGIEGDAATTADSEEQTADQ
jgi:hypothetical protein